jgi:HNH endonuclease
MKLIQLTQGEEALVDDEDYDRLSQHKWCANRKGNTYYAVRNIRVRPGKYTHLSMHVEIMRYHEGEPRKGLEVDHRDRDGLNNQKHNLRYATRSQNLQNNYTNNTGGFSGVRRYRGRDGDGWKARILRKVEGEFKFVCIEGIFPTAQDAYKAKQEYSNPHDKNVSIALDGY